MGMDTATDTPTTQEALAELDRAASKYREAERRAVAAKARRDDAMVAAQAAGATYPQMAAAAAVSRDRVAQVLARKRQG